MIDFRSSGNSSAKTTTGQRRAANCAGTVATCVKAAMRHLAQGNLPRPPGALPPHRSSHFSPAQQSPHSLHPSPPARAISPSCRCGQCGATCPGHRRGHQPTPAHSLPGGAPAARHKTREVKVKSHNWQVMLEIGVPARTAVRSEPPIEVSDTRRLFADAVLQKPTQL